MNSSTHRQQTATFAAGCFWGIEESFRQLPGVISTEVGYTGGETQNPSYEDVCTGRTGHAEAVRVIFDPERISYKDLLRVFWDSHDPTQKNRQGPDIGTQYRSAVFFHSPEQEQQAKQMKDTMTRQGILGKEIATEIVTEKPFNRAEEYHQQYMRKNGGACQR